VKVNEQGLALIRKFEGLRTGAYRDAAGVWTIGYGHTSCAGPPRVGRGMKITRTEAASILARDVAGFAEGVASHVRVPLSDGQFSALVSFAYNVGLENFRKSSVLRAVNDGDCSAVPRRLSLWVKAGGKVLPGLINRRAAEGALFMRGTSPAVTADAKRQRSPRREPIEPVQGRAMHRSSINLAAVLSADRRRVFACGRCLRSCRYRRCPHSGDCCRTRHRLRGDLDHQGTPAQIIRGGHLTCSGS
jgi:GH24 family phage-related lysozyme (muramidase)